MVVLLQTDEISIRIFNTRIGSFICSANLAQIDEYLRNALGFFLKINKKMNQIGSFFYPVCFVIVPLVSRTKPEGNASFTSLFLFPLALYNRQHTNLTKFPRGKPENWATLSIVQLI